MLKIRNDWSLTKFPIAKKFVEKCKPCFIIRHFNIQSIKSNQVIVQSYSRQNYILVIVYIFFYILWEIYIRECGDIIVMISVIINYARNQIAAATSLP